MTYKSFKHNWQVKAFTIFTFQINHSWFFLRLVYINIHKPSKYNENGNDPLDFSPED